MLIDLLTCPFACCSLCGVPGGCFVSRWAAGYAIAGVGDDGKDNGHKSFRASVMLEASHTFYSQFFLRRACTALHFKFMPVYCTVVERRPTCNHCEFFIRLCSAFSRALHLLRV